MTIAVIGATGILAGENDATSTFEQITGRSPRPLAEFLHENRPEFVGPTLVTGRQVSSASKNTNRTPPVASARAAGKNAPASAVVTARLAVS
jgi:hypothetical protein